MRRGRPMRRAVATIAAPARRKMAKAAAAPAMYHNATAAIRRRRNDPAPQGEPRDEGAYERR